MEDLFPILRQSLNGRELHESNLHETLIRHNRGLAMRSTTATQLNQSAATFSASTAARIAVS